MSQVFDTLPDYVFWDIKKPLGKDTPVIQNKYNGFRQYPFCSIFDHINYEEYLDRRNKRENISDAVSHHKPY